MIPTRDRHVFVARAIACALAQQHVAVEVVVVDDGSAVPVMAPEGDPRVRVVRNEVSGGEAAARNLGIRHARATWVAFLDDDDLWAPHKLRTQLQAAGSQAAGFVYAGAVVVDAELTPLSVEPAPDAPDLPVDLLKGSSVPAGASNVLVEAQVLERTGGFDESLVHTTDWDMWLRCIALTTPAAVEEPLVAYVFHDSNKLMRKVDAALVRREMAIMEGRYAAQYAASGVGLDRLSFDLWIAGAFLRGGRRWRATAEYVAAARRNRSFRAARRSAITLVGQLRWLRRLAGRVRPAPVAPDWLLDLQAAAASARPTSRANSPG